MNLIFSISKFEKDASLLGLYGFVKNTNQSNSIKNGLELDFVATDTSSLTFLPDTDFFYQRSLEESYVFFGLKSLQCFHSENSILILANDIETEFKILEEDGFINQISYDYFISSLKFLKKIIFTNEFYSNDSLHLSIFTQIQCLKLPSPNLGKNFYQTESDSIAIYNYSSSSIIVDNILTKGLENLNTEKKSTADQFHKLGQHFASIHLFYEPINNYLITDPITSAAAGEHVLILIEKHYSSPSFDEFKNEIRKFPNIQLFDSFEELKNILDNLIYAREFLQKNATNLNMINFRNSPKLAELSSKINKNFFSQFMVDKK